MSTITCQKCGNTIEIDKALEGQIEARVLATERHKHKEELEKQKLELTSQANEQVKKHLELEAEKSKQALEHEREKMKTEIKGESKKQLQKQELLIEQLRDDSKADKESAGELRELVKELREDLRAEKKARENAELEADKKLASKESKIREEAEKNATDKAHLKQLELEKKLADTMKSLEEANRKANQGSQQNQGEVLELELERQLASEFPLDEIEEVKKGSRGADIKQLVKTETLQQAGVLLWEIKNGKWQPAWVGKFKTDIREASANIGVIVSAELPKEYGDMQNVEKNVWIVKPSLAVVLASALRSTILQVHSMSKMSLGKDAKMEALFGFISGPEFRHRVEAIVENYGQLQEEIEKEKRASQLRWSRQEKSIRAVIDNTIGMYGDLQGITNRALPNIKSLELDSGDESNE